jgi:hypothetical protein
MPHPSEVPRFSVAIVLRLEKHLCNKREGSGTVGEGETLDAGLRGLPGPSAGSKHQFRRC